jgi:MFS family permease
VYLVVNTSPPLSLWRNRDYLLLWSGEIVSELGTQVSQLAYPLLILALTGSPAQAGLAGTLRSLPYLLLSLPAGALIDRWNRKLVMILCDTGRALCLASIALALAI